MKKEIRFYVTTLLGYILLIIGIFTPPLAVIDASILYASGMFLILAGVSIGLDVAEILKEIRLLKESLANLKNKDLSK